jgi:hypothetical protein
MFAKLYHVVDLATIPMGVSLRGDKDDNNVPDLHQVGQTIVQKVAFIRL